MKVKWMVSILTILFLTIGCSANNENKTGDQTTTETKDQDTNEKNNNQSNNEIQEGNSTQPQSDQTNEHQDNPSLKIDTNKELTKQVKEEDGVIDGQVYEQDGMAIGTLLLEKKVSNNEAKRLAEKYADELKKEYQDLIVNVQAVRDGKNVANITKE